MMPALLTVTLRYEQDVVVARQRSRHLSELLGFDVQDQTEIATAVSEIARNACVYAGGGSAEFSVEGRSSPQLLVVRISDSGPGIDHLDSVLAGNRRSSTGEGLGLIGARRLMDSFDVSSSQRGTVVTLRKLLPHRSPLIGPERIAQITLALASQRAGDHFAEIRLQNQELLTTLGELHRRQDELDRLNRELQDTNRGVVALYAELEERADHLRRADELKTRFLSNMTHEFRTPVNSILALSGLLMDGLDGTLNSEQEKQVSFIRKAAGDLSELVNDLLDLAKVEAGKTVIRCSEFEISDLFGALRGMLRPLLINQALALVFEECDEVPPLQTDESKVSQILRNLISNALKFTVSGEIRVAATFDPDSDQVRFSVADTGIGIAAENLARIFEEFSQIESPIQTQVKGTGLGLPLSKRLAELLGGRLTVESTIGNGSTFFLAIPRVMRLIDDHLPVVDPDVIPAGTMLILLIEDRPEDRLVIERLLRGSRYQLVAAANLRQARDLLNRTTPKAVLLDLMLGNEDAWQFLADFKSDPALKQVPVIVVTSIDDQAKAAALGADSYGLKPLDRSWLLSELGRLTSRRTALIIDDDEAARYTLRQMLRRAGWDAIEAAGGPDGLQLATSGYASAVFLDLAMPGMSGLDVLMQLRRGSITQHLPVFVTSAAILSADDRGLLESLGARIMPKGAIGSVGVAAALQEVESRARAFTYSDTPQI